jgi:hypothetical protein
VHRASGLKRPRARRTVGGVLRPEPASALRPAALGALLALALVGSASAAPPPVAHPPTEIMQEVSLQDGAAAGIVHLTAKGGFGGDVMAIDVDGARLPGKPVTVAVRIEFHGTQKDGTPWPQSKADQIAAGIEQHLAGLKGTDGTPVTIDVIPTVRSDAQPATPATHQIELKDRPTHSETNFIAGEVQPGDIHTGEFGTNEQAIVYAHETLHILGWHDRYLALQPDAYIKGVRYPLPKFTGDKSDTAALDQWFANVLAAEKKLEAEKGGKSELVPGIPPGHEHDLLANTQTDPTATLAPVDVDQLIARAGVHVTARPGDLLLSKDETLQNLGIGARTDLYAPRGGTAHADGIWGYCIDLKRHSPQAGVAYDVLGPAAALGSPQMSALALLLERIGSDPEAYGYSGPLGAQGAVWDLTEAITPSGDEAALLASAGVTYDETLFGTTPHFANPNAGNPATGAVTTTGVLPTTPADRSPAPTTPIDGPSTTPATYKPTALVVRTPRTVKLRAKGTAGSPLKVTTLPLALVLDGSGDAVTVAMRRSGKKTTQIVVATVHVPLGPSETKIALPKLRPGKYRVKVSGAGGWFRTKTVTLVRPKRHH